MSTPIVMRIRGVMRLFSKEYLDKKNDTEEKDEATDPGEKLHAMKASQSMAARAGLGSAGGGLVRQGTGAGGGFVTIPEAVEASHV